MSFATNRPFYPYSEPSDRQQSASASPGGRALQVTILSNERMTGTLTNESDWPGKIEFAGPALPPGVLEAFMVKQWTEYAGLKNKNSGEVNMPTTLTTFLDNSNPRPGTADLYFSPDHVQSSYKAEIVNLNLPPQERLIFRYTPSDFVALLMLIVLPTVPLYCGWKVLNQWPDDEKNPLSARRISGLPIRSQLKGARNLKARLGDGFVGVMAIVIGLFFGMQFILLFLSEVVSALLRWSNTAGNWSWGFAGIFATTLMIVAMSWGMLFCGVNVLRLRAMDRPLSRTNLFYAEGAWQGFMGSLSLSAGGLACLAVIGVIASLLSL